MYTKRNLLGPIATYEIRGGPNREILCNALLYACDPEVYVRVDFDVRGAAPDGRIKRAAIYDVFLVSIEHGRQDGYNLAIEGYCQITLLHEQEEREYFFKAKYDAKKRSGKIKFYTEI